MTTTRLEDPTVTLTDGTTTVSFTVARGDNGERLIRPLMTPTQEAGERGKPFVMVFPFGFQGMGYSDIPVGDAYDYGQSDVRALGKLYPPPLRTTLVPGGSGPNGTVRAIWKGKSPGGSEYVYAMGGTQGARFSPASPDTLMGTIDHGAGNSVTGPPALYGGDWYLPMGASRAFRVLTTITDVFGTDTWVDGPTSGSPLSASAFCVGFAGGSGSSTASGTAKLVRGDSNGLIYLASADPTVAGNWGTGYQIGTNGEPVNALVQLGAMNNVYVAKTDGLFAVATDTSGTNLTPDLAFASNQNNGKQSFGAWGRVFYPCTVGLYRAIGDVCKTVGIEMLPAFNGPIRGRVNAMAALGRWLYFALYDGTDSWIFAGRIREEGENGFGEIVFYSLEKIASTEIGAMYVDPGTDSRNPRLWFGVGINMGYYTLGKNGGFDPGDTTNTKYSTGTIEHYFSANDNQKPGTLKVFETAEVTAGGCSGSQYWTISASVDGGAYAAIGTNGRVTANGFTRLTWTRGTNDVGRYLKLKAVATNGSQTAPCYLDRGAIIVRGHERPVQKRLLQCVLESPEYLPSIMDGYTALSRLTVLNGWSSPADGATTDPVLTFTDNLSGETFSVRIVQVSRAEQSAQMSDRPTYTVTVDFEEVLN